MEEYLPTFKYITEGILLVRLFQNSQEIIMFADCFRLYWRVWERWVLGGVLQEISQVFPPPHVVSGRVRLSLHPDGHIAVRSACSLHGAYL